MAIFNQYFMNNDKLVRSTYKIVFYPPIFSYYPWKNVTTRILFQVITCTTLHVILKERRLHKSN